MRCSDGSASGNSRRCGLCAEYQEQAEPWQIYSGVFGPMLRGYWRVIIAVIGLAIAGLGSAVTYQLYDASQQRHSDYHYQPASHPGFQVDVSGKPIATSYQPNCENPQKPESADLCAQWAAVGQVAESNRMASLNLRFAIASLWATAIATVALIWTLIETRETARRELRAYLFVDAYELGDGTHLDPDNLHGKVALFIAIKNSGSTPAHRVAHWSAVDITSLADEASMTAPAKLEPTNLSTIPPGGNITGTRVMPKKPTARTVAAIKAGRSAVFVYGAIEYWDVFDRRHRTDYRLKFTGAWPPPPNPVLAYCGSGNDAT